jgi:DNA-directed RNA polymerase subunit RPC12/RpoP
MKCEKCGKDTISQTDDKPFGLRNHCLYCGYVWKVKEEPAVTKQTRKGK